MNKKIIRAFYILLFSGICLIMASFATTSMVKSVKINNEEVTSFNSGWSYSINGNSGGDITLPAKVPAKEYDKVVISNTLPEHYTEGMTICLRAVQQFVRVRVEGSEIYQFGYDGDRLIGKTPGSAWCFIRLGKETQGKNIEVEFVSPYKHYSQKVNGINYGSKNSNVFNIIEDNVMGLFISAIIIIIGFALIMAYLVFRKYSNSEPLLYLGLFAVCAGFWSLTETRMLQFFLGNQSPLIVMAFVFLMLLPVPLLMFVAETHWLHNKKTFHIMCWIIMSNTVVISTLQVLNIVDFLESAYITHSVLIVGAAVVVGTIAVEIFKYKNKEIYVLGAGSAVFVLISSLDFLQFYQGFTGDNSYFFRIAVLLYILLLAYYSMRRLFNIISDSMRTEVLEQLAFEDLLTGLRNRTCFEHEMEEYRATNENCKGLAIAIFDVNNLKAINDTLGHRVGDELIVRSAGCIDKVFADIGQVYRVGGDEFAVIINNIPPVDLVEIVAQVEDVVSKQGTEYAMSISGGAAAFDESIDKNADDLYARADGKMYKRKAEYKKNSEIS